MFIRTGIELVIDIFESHKVAKMDNSIRVGGIIYRWQLKLWRANSSQTAGLDMAQTTTVPVLFCDKSNLY